MIMIKGDKCDFDKFFMEFIRLEGKIILFFIKC